MRIYIAGPMSGIKDYNHHNFNTLEFSLKTVGLDVVNPAKLNEIKDGEEHWRRCIGVCVAELLTCDAIITLPNWHHSRGAVLELVVAKIARLRYYTIEPLPNNDFWVGEAPWPTASLVRAVTQMLHKKW